jgi:hypothetical protein
MAEEKKEPPPIPKKEKTPKPKKETKAPIRYIALSEDDQSKK